MTKQNAIDLFGSPVETSRAIGCTRGAVSNWPDNLPDRIADRVIAAAVRRGIDVSDLIEMEAREAA